MNPNVIQKTTEYHRELQSKRDRVNRINKPLMACWKTSGDLFFSNFVIKIRAEYDIELIFNAQTILEDVIVHDEKKLTMFLLKYGN